MHRLPSLHGTSALRAILCVLVLIMAACEVVRPSVYSDDIDDLLEHGRRYAKHLRSEPAAALAEEEIVALGYLERVRLGLGGPFRLAAFALKDRRMSPEVGQAVAYALLKETLDGRTYQVDPSLLSLVRLKSVHPGVPTGEHLYGLVEEAISSAATPRGGERAVRLGFTISEAERTIEHQPSSIVAHTAALIADRHQAQGDVRRLLHSATELRVDPMELLVEWRRTRRFHVERPALFPLSARDREAEAQGALRVATALRNLSQRLAAPFSGAPPSRAMSSDPDPSWLSADAAERLAAIAEAQDYPPQAPVAVAVEINRERFLGREGLAETQRDLRREFTRSAYNEERLVSGAAKLRAAGAAEGPRLPLMMLQSGVFLRGWNQEEPWFPGDPAPLARDLEARFALAAVEFDESVPEAWRPYYRRMLARALTDLQRVLPTASVAGLRVHFGEPPVGLRALATHTPGTRTLLLPPRSGSGTIAHEVTHDLDWQLARKRYNRRGGYATDLAVRGRRGDRIASSLAELATTLIRTPPGVTPSDHETRPAEVFARGMDWFVAVMLAREGMTGGYLTSFQDAALTGYGTTRGPDVRGSAIPTLLMVLEQIAPVDDATRRWALDSYGPLRTLNTKELVEAVVSSTAPETPWARLAAVEDVRGKVLRSMGEQCAATASDRDRRLIEYQRRVVDATSRAIVRGAVVDGVRQVATSVVPGATELEVDAWLAWRLSGAPEPADSTLHALEYELKALQLRARDALSGEVHAAGDGFGFSAPPVLCGGNPFASGRSVSRGPRPTAVQVERDPLVQLAQSEQTRWLGANPHNGSVRSNSRPAFWKRHGSRSLGR